MTKAIQGDFDKIGATSIALSTVSGLGMNYYTYNDASGPKRNLYVQLRGVNLFQGQSIEPLIKLRELISQARQKLVALGAK